jgi:uroporphyrinogen decarboxylase
MAKKDEMIRILNHEAPTRFVHPTDIYMVFTPGEHNMGGEKNEQGYIVGDDWFGCSWTEVGQSPIDGATLTPGQEPLEEICEFKEAGCIPTAQQIRAFDWEGYAKKILEHYNPEEDFLQCRSLIGFFERMHCLIGFENALCAFYEDPDAVHEFFQAMLEYKKTVVDCVAEYIKPDLMIFDDDYGTMRSTFMDPDMWREFFPQYWKELVDYTHAKGMKVELHSCGYITPLVGDFVELGFDALQPLQTNNDFKKIKEIAGGRMALRMAIFDKQMATVDQTEDEIRTELRGYYETLAPGGDFLPDLVPINDPYYKLQAEVQDAYEKELYGVDGNAASDFINMVCSQPA